MQENRLSNRRFGLAVGGVLLAAGCIFYFLFGNFVVLLFYIGVFLAVVGLVLPKLLLPLNRIWTWLARYVFLITNYVLLGAVYFVLLVPVGLIMRLAGRDPLSLRRSASGETMLRPVGRQLDSRTFKDMF